MPFIPHTDQDVHTMLATIGVAKLDNLFDEIPDSLRDESLSTLTAGLTEMELTRLMQEKSKQDSGSLCFIGAGAYEHHIPAAVWEVASRGEFLTAYTPYQAEASQGTLQLLYEYQTMMASLMGLDVSNASLYDGASALAEAILMAVRSNRQRKQPCILLPETVHPYYRQVVKTIVGQQGIEIVEVPFDKATGQTDILYLEKHVDTATVLVIPQPNFFGVLEEMNTLTEWAHDHQLLVIGIVNPLAMALLKPPGQWGKKGADIACGEGQPLGVPLASGGPYYGFLCCKKELVRQLPGRIAGRTVDAEGKIGFVLTLQAREQHIRRAKATSNICTNQGLLVTASTIFMSLMGPTGLRRMAVACFHHTQNLALKLSAISGVELVFHTPRFHEIVLRLPQPVHVVLDELAKMHIQGGVALQSFYPNYPEFQNCLLVCVTETKANLDLDEYADKLQHVLTQLADTHSVVVETNMTAD